METVKYSKKEIFEAVKQSSVYRIKKGVNFDNKDMMNKDSRTLMDIAICHGQIEIIKILIEKGANIHCIDAIKKGNLHNKTALGLAIHCSQIEITKLLLKNGAKMDINLRDRNKRTFLHEAAENGNIELAELLINNGADIFLEPQFHGNFLHIAAYHGQLDFIKYYIKKGFDINFRNKRRETLLHQASLGGMFETVKYLLNNGAKFDAKTNNGRIPFDFCVADRFNMTNKKINEYDEINKILLSEINENKWDPNKIQEGKWSTDKWAEQEEMFEEIRRNRDKIEKVSINIIYKKEEK